MEYIWLVTEVILRWMLMGFVVMYILTSLSFISGLIESGCGAKEAIKLYLTKAPIRIFSIWIMKGRFIIKAILLWPLTLIDYADVLYDTYSELFKKS